MGEKKKHPEGQLSPKLEASPLNQEAKGASDGPAEL